MSQTRGIKKTTITKEYSVTCYTLCIELHCYTLLNFPSKISLYLLKSSKRQFFSAGVNGSERLDAVTQSAFFFPMYLPRLHCTVVLLKMDKN